MRVNIEFSEHRVLVAGACGFVGLAALHLAYPGLFDYWPKTSSELADWVAAVGTVSAIAAGFVVANRQQRHQADMQAALLAETTRLQKLYCYRLVVSVFTSAAALINISKNRTKPNFGEDHKWDLVKSILLEARGILDISKDARITDVYFVEQAKVMNVVLLSLHQQLVDVDESSDLTSDFIDHMYWQFQVHQGRASDLAEIAAKKVEEIALPNELADFHKTRDAVSLAAGMR
ncbi:hypothetical protein LJR118_002139 [Acidovorax sp. LjRoot118]